MTRQPRIYYAASLFNEGERAFNREVVAMLHELGYSIWFPQDDVGPVADFMEKDGMTLTEARRHVFELNIEEVRNVDLLVICLDGRVPDEGACVEAGIAWGLGKRVIALRTDDRSAGPGGDNIMIDGIVAEIAHSVDELRALLDPGNMIVDLTGPDPIVSFRSVPSPSEVAPPN